MMVLVVGLATLWAAAVLVVVAVCRSAARADARRRVVTVGLAVAWGVGRRGTRGARRC